MSNLETIIFEWCRIISSIANKETLPVECLQIAASPRTEIEFWSRRKKDLVQIHSVLTSKTMGFMSHLLRRLGSVNLTTISCLLNTIDDGNKLETFICIEARNFKTIAYFF